MKQDDSFGTVEKYREIVERLKKRIEELEKKEQLYYTTVMIKELQKILGEKI